MVLRVSASHLGGDRRRTAGRPRGRRWPGRCDSATTGCSDADGGGRELRAGVDDARVDPARRPRPGTPGRSTGTAPRMLPSSEKTTRAGEAAAAAAGRPSRGRSPGRWPTAAAPARRRLSPLGRGRHRSIAGAIGHLLDDGRLGPALVERVGDAVVVVAAHQHGAEHARPGPGSRARRRRTGWRPCADGVDSSWSLTGSGWKICHKITGWTGPPPVLREYPRSCRCPRSRRPGRRPTPVHSPPTSVTKRDPGVTDIHPMSEEGPQGERGAAGVRSPWGVPTAWCRGGRT